MKKVFLILISCILAVALLAGCQKEDQGEGKTETGSSGFELSTVVSNNDEEEIPDEKAKPEEKSGEKEVIEQTTGEGINSEENDVKEKRIVFSIEYKGKSLRVFDWDDKVDIEAIFGKPLSENIEILGEGADTFTGSYVKELKYKGLEIVLMSPKDNGESFVVLMMTVSSDEYITADGLKVGDSLETLRKIHSNVKKVEDGSQDENNTIYEIKDEHNNFMEFVVVNGRISEIILGNELQ